MPANLTPAYKSAESAYKQAGDPKERLELLREMLRLIPKHKGTDHLQADIKSKIKELTDEIVRLSSQPARGFKVGSTSVEAQKLQVARGGSNEALRAHTALQCKAAVRRHNALRQAAPTRQCGAVYAPFGRAAKRPSAALRSLELARLVRRSRALQPTAMDGGSANDCREQSWLNASRSAERVITSAANH